MQSSRLLSLIHKFWHHGRHHFGVFGARSDHICTRSESSGGYPDWIRLKTCVNQRLACWIVCFTLYVTLIYKLKPVDEVWSWLSGPRTSQSDVMVSLAEGKLAWFAWNLQEFTATFKMWGAQSPSTLRPGVTFSSLCVRLRVCIFICYRLSTLELIGKSGHIAVESLLRELLLKCCPLTRQAPKIKYPVIVFFNYILTYCIFVSLLIYFFIKSIISLIWGGKSLVL